MNLRPQRKWRTWSCEHGSLVKGMRLCQWLVWRWVARSLPAEQEKLGDFDCFSLIQADVLASSTDALSNDEAIRLRHVETSESESSHPLASELLKQWVILNAELNFTVNNQESSGYSAREGCFGHKLYNTCIKNENSRLADAYQRRH